MTQDGGDTRGSGVPEISVPVEAGGGDKSYTVRVGAGLRTQLGHMLATAGSPTRWAVISDEAVAALHGQAAVDALDAADLNATLYTFPVGERSKNRTEWARLSDALLADGFARDCGVIGLGGGVTGDLAGFVAATFMRGIPVVQVPTSLLAMIDASVGGKTGVNAPAGKNLVGAFHAPRLVVVDPEFTTTLSRELRAQGLAEAIKHGVIRDASYFDALEADAQRLLAGDVGATQRAVAHSVRVKAEVVSADEREAGLRKILNFGHTLGHGIEAASDYGLPHGHAVAIGMVAEARMGEELGVTEAGTTHRVRAVTQRFGLPSAVPAGLDPRRVLAAIQADKKGKRGSPEWVPVTKIGAAGVGDGRLTLPLDDTQAHEAIFGGGGQATAL